MSSVKLRSQNDNIFVPRKREGTKTFLDVPMELRKKDFNSPSGQFFMKTLPEGIRECFQRAILETGIESEDTLWWLKYVLLRMKKEIRFRQLPDGHMITLIIRVRSSIFMEKKMLCLKWIRVIFSLLERVLFMIVSKP